MFSVFISKSGREYRLIRIITAAGMASISTVYSEARPLCAPP
jgi:hypothetical protein